MKIILSILAMHTYCLCLVRCTRDGCTWIQFNKTCIGGGTPNNLAKTLAACQESCKNMPTCRGFDWYPYSPRNPSYGTRCWTLTTTENKKSDERFVHYDLSCQSRDIANRYIGCFYDDGKQSNRTVGFYQSSNLTINICLERCRNLKRTYAILQNGTDCLCGDSIKTGLGLSDDLCNVTCSGNSVEHCGGGSEKQLQYSVTYAVCPIGRYLADCSGVCHCKDQIPCDLLTGVCPNGCEGNWTNSNCNEESTFVGRYIGCYKDSSTRALPVWYKNFKNSNPIRWCSRICALNASTYAGLQHHDHCLCGDSHDRHGKSEEGECNRSCLGNTSQVCGGAWRNSVYSVCSAGRFGQECLNRCNCREKEVCNVLTGTCNSGCKPGWTGDSCSMRNCSSNNGDCSANETCVTVNLGYASVSRCVCYSGYGRDTPWDNCRANPLILPSTAEFHSTSYVYTYEIIIGVVGGSVAGMIIICIIISICRRKQRTVRAKRMVDDYSDQVALEACDLTNGSETDSEAMDKYTLAYH